MKNIFFCITTLFILWTPERTLAQQQLYSNQSLYLLSLDNIAATTASSAVQSIYRRNWMPLSYSPELALIHVEGRFLNTKETWDLKISSMSTGVIRQTELKTGFAYHLLKEAQQQLSFGIRAGIIRSSINWNDLSVKSPEELEMANTLVNRVRPSFDAGFYYSFRGFNISLSSLHFTGNFRSTQPDFYRILSDNQLTFSWQLRSKTSTLTPALTFRSTQGMPLLATIGLQYQLRKIAEMALGIRSNKALFSTFGLHLHNRFYVFFGFDYSLKLSSLTGPGNEFGFTYRLK